MQITDDLKIVAEKAYKGIPFGFLFDGELHVAPEIYDALTDEDTKDAVMKQLNIVDMYDMMFLADFEEVDVFVGQQVQVWYNGKYKGSATVTEYPLRYSDQLARIKFTDPGSEFSEHVFPIDCFQVVKK
jgi:hypothetical protein